jgi:hypothetical protein
VRDDGVQAGRGQVLFVVGLILKVRSRTGRRARDDRGGGLAGSGGGMNKKKHP